MMRSSILGASALLNVLIQHLPLQSLFWSKTWRACQASYPSTRHLTSKKFFKEKGRNSFKMMLCMQGDNVSVLSFFLIANLRGVEQNLKKSSSLSPFYVHRVRNV